MKGQGVALVVALVGFGTTAFAHPVPFSYLDLRPQPGSIEITLVAHVFDLAHDLGIDPSDRLLEPALLQTQIGKITALVEGRIRIDADGRQLVGGVWTAPEILVDRQSLQLQGRYDLTRPPGHLTVMASLFPYDPAHQTFVNFYEREAIATQVILDRARTRFDYFTGSREGFFAVSSRFVADGVRHILVGPEHLLFLAGLLLLGGTRRQLFVVVSAFTLAHCLTLSLAALRIVSPPARLIEPAIALTIVYLGLDNLLVRDGRDMRAWIALAFGLIHGLGFAGVLRDMDLSRRALGWSLLSFNVGIEISQLFVIMAVASLIAALKSRTTWADRQLAVAGSLVVMAAGTFWFIQRVFFPGGIS